MQLNKIFAKYCTAPSSFHSEHTQYIFSHFFGIYQDYLDKISSYCIGYFIA